MPKSNLVWFLHHLSLKVSRSVVLIRALYELLQLFHRGLNLDCRLERLYAQYHNLKT